MADPTSCDTPEVLYVPESPPGATAQHYRTGAYEIPCFVLVSGTLTVRLLEDPSRARFTFECLVQPARETAGAEDEFAAEEWIYDIPVMDGEVTGPQAWDGVGTLQTTLQPPEAKAVRLRVRFRQLLRNDSHYRFWYAYEAPVRTVVSTRLLSRMVVCTGWLIFNLPCESIRVCIQLPDRARLTKSVPLGEVTEPEPRRTQVRYQLERLRSLETSQWLVAYERRRIGLPLYVWTLAQVVAGIAGWLIGRALDGWTGRP
jgi:hypothetical protein